MPDLIATALDTLRTAKTTTKESCDLLEAVARGLRPATAVADVLARLANVQGLHLELAHHLLQLEQTLRNEQAMRFEDPVYWRQPASGPRLGPYCPVCWDLQRKAVQLGNSPFRGHDRWICRACTRTFFSAGARDAMALAERSARRRRGEDDELQ